jgi:hypothetical protein
LVAEQSSLGDTDVGRFVALIADAKKRAGIAEDEHAEFSDSDEDEDE